MTKVRLPCVCGRTHYSQKTFADCPANSRRAAKTEPVAVTAAQRLSTYGVDDTPDDDGKPEPLPAGSPYIVELEDGYVDGRCQAVQDGKVFDQVRVTEEGGYQTNYHRRREGTYPNWPNNFRFQSDRPITDKEMKRAAQLIGYAYRAEIRGEPMNDPERDSPYSFSVWSDSTKTRSDDLGMALERFEEDLPGMLEHGSPVRKTNRSGEGTKGTRLVDGLGTNGPKFTLYYDSVVEDDGNGQLSYP